MATVAEMDALGLRQTIREELDRSGLANLVRQLQADAAPVTALPASALAGQEVYLQTAAMAALSPPVKWLLRYDGSKWVFVGGAPLFAEIHPGIVSDQSTASTTYVALTTPGPSVALPVAGSYDVEIGYGAYNSVLGSQIYMSYDIGAAPAVDADACLFQNGVANGDVLRGSRTARKVGLAAVTLTAKYRNNAGTTAYRGPRWMRVTPVLLG